MNTQNVRVRFAPSPTGPLHIGGVRTALYNYLFAKKYNGTFILRIEDTDQTRFVNKAEEYIQESLDWCGISPDESPWKPGEYGPYRQSERKSMYKEYADFMIQNGTAYYAFDTPEELDEVRNRAKEAKMPNWQYNHITRNSMQNSLTLSEDVVNEKIANGDPYVIRIKIPRNEEIRFEDEIRGWVTVNSSNIDDKVIFKSDGMPTYHLANIVDDHTMEITHVIRGEEWLPSAPLHVLLYRYLGWEETMPKLAHLPLILKPDGNGKLSKRDGDRLGFPVFPLNWLDEKTGEQSSGYRERGYFPEAFTNMLAFLGWNPGTNEELFTLSALVESFTLDRVGKSGAKFDAQKALWYQQQYLRTKENTEIAQLIIPSLPENEYSIEHIQEICGLMKERATFLNDIITEGEYFFNAPTSYDAKTVKKKWKEQTPSLLNDLLKDFSQISDFKHDEIEKVFSDFLKKKEIGFGQIGPAFRLAVTGKGMGPSLFSICEILGQQETLQRISTALETIK
mgnify:CR=1 FL=1